MPKGILFNLQFKYFVMKKNNVLQVRIGKRILFLLEKKGWTELYLAKITGLNKDVLNSYITARKGAGPKNLSLVIRAFGLSPEQFYRSALFSRKIDHS